jgi:hypothetical protein
MKHPYLSTFVVVYFLAFITSTIDASAKDVTKLVIDHTDFAENIKKLCSEYCLGNQSAGHLKRVSVEHIAGNLYRVIAYADLVNKHDLGIGGGFGWSYTVELEARGTLNSADCNLRIDTITVRNDRLGLGNAAKKEEGKVHKIANCQRFL